MIAKENDLTFRREQAVLDQGFRPEQAAMNLEQRKEEAELARDKLQASDC